MKAVHESTDPYRSKLSVQALVRFLSGLLMLGLLSLALLYLALRPTPIVRGEDEPELDRETLNKIGVCVGLLLVFAATFETLGFIVSSILIGVPMARLYGGRWLHSAVIVGFMSIALYVLFDRVMDVPLPLGLLDVLGN